MRDRLEEDGRRRSTDGRGPPRPAPGRRSSSRSGAPGGARAAAPRARSPVIPGISMSVTTDRRPDPVRRRPAGAPRGRPRPRRPRCRRRSRARATKARTTGSSSTTSTTRRAARVAGVGGRARLRAGSPPIVDLDPPCPRGVAPRRRLAAVHRSHRSAGSPMGRMPYRAAARAAPPFAPERPARGAPRARRARRARGRGSTGPSRSLVGSGESGGRSASQAVRQPAARAPTTSAAQSSPTWRIAPGRRVAERRARGREDRGMRLDRADPLADDDRPEVRQPAARLGVAVDRRRERPVREDRQVASAGQAGEQRRRRPGVGGQPRRRMPGCTPRRPSRPRPDPSASAARAWSHALVGGRRRSMPRSRAKTRTRRSARSTSRNCGTSSRNCRSRSSAQAARNASRSRSRPACARSRRL